MKKIIVLTAIVLALLGTYAFKRIDKRFEDIFKQLGVELPEAKGSILNDFVDGTLLFPHSELYVKLALGKRAEAVKEIGDFIKKYTESAEFVELYKQAREEAKPHIESIDEKIQNRIETVKHKDWKYCFRSGKETITAARAYAQQWLKELN